MAAKKKSDGPSRRGGAAKKATRRRASAPRRGGGAGPVLVGLALAVVAVFALVQAVERRDAAEGATSAAVQQEADVARSDFRAVAPSPAGRSAVSAASPPTTAVREPRAPAASIASDVTPRQPPTPGDAPARVAIVLDDCGQRLDLMQRAVRIDVPLTFAVIPHLEHSRASAELAAAAGHEVIVHQPMEPEGHPAFDPDGAIVTGMGASEVRDVLARSLASVPHAVGMNNHMGSRATASPTLMGHVLGAVAATPGPRGPLYFLDSRTSAETVALDTARRLGVPTARRHVFLDNEDDPVHVRRQLEELLATAREEGEAIGIGHLKPVTLTVLDAVLPGLPPDEYRLVFASSVVR